jgi:hypothetical protein
MNEKPKKSFAKTKRIKDPWDFDAPNAVDILPSLKEGDSYGSDLGYRSVASAGSSPELALESFTVSSDPCSFGLTVSYMRSVTFGLSDRRSFDAGNCKKWNNYGQQKQAR